METPCPCIQLTKATREPAQSSACSGRSVPPWLTSPFDFQAAGGDQGDAHTVAQRARAFSAVATSHVSSGGEQPPGGIRTRSNDSPPPLSVVKRRSASASPR